MKIALVVHGRFHAFDLARSLLARGHDVTVFTNYPKRVARRFDVPESSIRSFVLHGVCARVVDRSPLAAIAEDHLWLHRMFGVWAARQLRREKWDVIHAFSGIAEELLKDSSIRAGSKDIMRGSAHIRYQHQLLTEEEQRTGSPLKKPSLAMIQREEREYDLADRIFVLSTFAVRSFTAQHVDRAKIVMLPLGADTRHFRSSHDVAASRIRRILEGAPLRVLMVGSLSCRKGVMDFCTIVQQVNPSGFKFRFVGDVPKEAHTFLAPVRDRIELVPRQAQFDLPRSYAWGDVFVFPTVEDGFAVVLSQAQASGLPILTTTNCSGSDIVRDGESGWVLPIRRPDAFIDKLLWCENHRSELAGMATKLYEACNHRDWNDVAADLEAAVASPAHRLV